MNCSRNDCQFWSHLHNVSCASETACRILFSLPCKWSEQICPFAFSLFWMIFICKFILSCPSCAPIPFDRRSVGIKHATMTSIVWFVQSTMFFALGALLITKAYLFSLFGKAGLNWLQLAFPLSPFWFNHAGGLSLYFCIIFNLLKNKQEGPSPDWNSFLHQIQLGQPLARHIHSKCFAR